MLALKCNTSRRDKQTAQQHHSCGEAMHESVTAQIETSERALSNDMSRKVNVPFNSKREK